MATATKPPKAASSSIKPPKAASSSIKPQKAASSSIKSPKAASASDCTTLEQLPNIGPAMAADLRAIGIRHPQQLAGHDAYALYRALCRHTGKRQDPCVLDTFMAATDFMRGAAPAPWWAYTAQRKALYGQVGA